MSKAAACGVAGLMTALALTACSSKDDSDAGSKTDGSQSDSGRQTPSQVVQATNKKTTQAGSARVSITTTLGSDGKSQAVTGRGVMDLADGTSELTMGDASQQLEQRVVDQVLYQKPPKGQGGLPGGKSWMKIDLKRLRASGASGSSQVSDPSDSFAYSKSLSEKDVKKVGDAKVHGVSTTHYQVMLDIDKLAKGDAKQAKKMREQLGDDVPVDLWIDDKGLTRRQQIALSAKSSKGGDGQVKTVMDFSDFGTDVDVDAPASDQTVDMTGKVLKQAQQKA